MIGPFGIEQFVFGHRPMRYHAGDVAADDFLPDAGLLHLLDDRNAFTG